MDIKQVKRNKYNELTLVSIIHFHPQIASILFHQVSI